ncbi:SPOR domain-containing protein [Orrella daihaiensis]|uniref:SPOR domain-containing protein n=1 Tax=Orrella daihaiensis TaxID=2782176 RepID=A0ABY4AGF9_9BURK|nr:SPOR domain-containing protein [Orrella daihaiensis]UOD49379.1 SPOR domain-containing protein [Orrella daihaiensis]
MGLFSRKEAKSSRRTAHRPRPSVSSEAQAASLRVRARRRLAGAVALVLAAVIVLPMLLDGEPRPVPAGIEIAVPERNAAFNPQLSAPPTTDPSAESNAGVAATPETSGLPKEAVGNVGVPSTDLTAGAPAAGKPAATTQPKPESKPESKPVAAQEAQSSPAPKAAAATAASEVAKPDQTAEALAILAGRQPSATASSATGSFVLQVASYGSDTEAKSRLDKLKTQGVSNAFVEPATVNGKQTFRLRVGPFDSRAAAQAAQARLRTLGYDNGFITTK